MQKIFPEKALSYLEPPITVPDDTGWEKLTFDDILEIPLTYCLSGTFPADDGYIAETEIIFSTVDYPNETPFQ